VVLQWEDFKQHNAIRILDRYRHRITCFNDDIQGTGGVVLGGILAGLRKIGQPLCQQRFVFLGAGAAGIGIARLIRLAMRQEGASEKTIQEVIAMVDTQGLLFDGRASLDEDKKPFVLHPSEMSLYGFSPSSHYDLETVVRHFKPTILIGTSGVPGAFTEGVIREMAKHVSWPMIFPLSNPTSKTEAAPADILRWTEGRALVATGSPFPPLEYQGKTHVIGQANNVFVFPGIGLGAIVSVAHEITEEIFLVAARALGECISNERLAQGSLYPKGSDLRQVTRQVAIAVVRKARDSGIGRTYRDDQIETKVDEEMWYPEYISYLPA
jgi:malic enzyme